MPAPGEYVWRDIERVTRSLKRDGGLVLHVGVGTEDWAAITTAYGHPDATSLIWSDGRHRVIVFHADESKAQRRAKR